MTTMVFTIDNTDMYFKMLENCKGVMQNQEHHPEGDVFTHSLQVMIHAFRESNDIDVIIAAMMHDVGKAFTRYGHSKVAVDMLYDYATPKTLFLIENHMRIWDYLLGDMQKLSKCAFLINHPWFPELIQLARWDKKGRKANWEPKYDKESIVAKLNTIIEERFVTNKKQSNSHIK